MADAGGIFSDPQPFLDRLRQGPGEEARREMAVTDSSPPPSRWTLRTIRATFELLGGMTLSGVWRALQGRLGIALRSGAVQHYSPDSEYASKYDNLIMCLNQAATMPERVALVFLDEMGYTRWPEPGPDWTARAPAPPPETDRAAGPNRLWRIIGALNAVTGRVDFLDAYIVGRAKESSFINNVNFELTIMGLKSQKIQNVDYQSCKNISQLTAELDFSLNISNQYVLMHLFQSP